MLLLAVFLSGLSGCSVPLPGNQPIETTSIELTDPSATSQSADFVSPMPTATPIPQVRISEAEKYLFNGDYSLSRQSFLAAQTSSSDPEIQAEVLWGLARIEYNEGYFDQSLVHLNDLIKKYPDSPHLGHALFLQGQCFSQLRQFPEVVSSFMAYKDDRPGYLDGYLFELIGDAQAEMGDYTSAIGSYQLALQDPLIENVDRLKIAIARMHASLGDYPASISIYSEIASTAEDDYLKAQMDFLTGQAYLFLDQKDKAYEYFLDAVTNFPQSYDSYSALVALVEAGVPVDDLDRGLVDYFADQYGVALAAFNRYIVDHPDHDGTVFHYLALVLREEGDSQQAIDYWDKLIQGYPENRFWETAWDERAYTMWAYHDDFSGASQTLLDFVNLYPDHMKAPYFLNSAARILERGAYLELASQTWQRLAVEYASSELVPDALINAGLQYYRLADFSQSLSIFEKGLLLSPLPTEQSRAYFWIGKTQLAMGNSEKSRESFQLAAGLDPTGYYSERARDILLGKKIFTSPKSISFTYNVEEERKQAESWLRITFNFPIETSMSGLQDLESDPRFLRGTEFYYLGLLEEARSEFEELRISYSQDPLKSYKFANYMVELGFYRIAISSSRQLLKMTGLDTYSKMLAAPNYFLHMNYGPYFQDLVVQYSAEFDFDPLLIFSVIIQESAFEGFVHSSAGARGLMQIMPATGESIAENMGWPLNFSPDDLYRPQISIRLGTSYLYTNYSYFNQDYFAALAAYNAGPGNAMIWKDLAGDDPDLFLELVRYSETRDYIQHIYEIYVVYSSLYGLNP